MVVRSMNTFPTDRVRYWANQLAGEARGPGWLQYSYVVPEVLEDISLELTDASRGLIGLVGQQGVGKSSALMALSRGLPFSLSPNRILFKWRPEKDLYKSLLNNTHEASNAFASRYLPALAMEIWLCHSYSTVEDERRYYEFRSHVENRTSPDTSAVLWAEGQIGKAATLRIRQESWLNAVRYADVVLIDTPDYSKTDKRRMDRDLEDIYWFWNNLMSAGSGSTIVVAIQKEMFRDHYFLDKMRKFELKPLEPEKMVEAYVRTFETTYPFSEKALHALAQMSRGIFRRFLRYIVLALDFWEKPDRADTIDEAIVEKAVPLDRLAADLELEFAGIFPKNTDLRILAVRVIMYLQKNGSTKQSALARELDVEPFALSRLLGKLELSKHLIRIRKGTEKTVALRPPGASCDQEHSSIFS